MSAVPRRGSASRVPGYTSVTGPVSIPKSAARKCGYERVSARRLADCAMDRYFFRPLAERHAPPRDS